MLTLHQGGGDALVLPQLIHLFSAEPYPFHVSLKISKSGDPR